MPQFNMPTEQEFKKNPSFKGMKYRDLFPVEQFTCDICQKPINGGDWYVFVPMSGTTPQCRHMLCDPAYK